MVTSGADLNLNPHLSPLSVVLDVGRREPDDIPSAEVLDDTLELGTELTHVLRKQRAAAR